MNYYNCLVFCLLVCLFAYHFILSALKSALIYLRTKEFMGHRTLGAKTKNVQDKLRWLVTLLAHGRCSDVGGRKEDRQEIQEECSISGERRCLPRNSGINFGTTKLSFPLSFLKVYLMRAYCKCFNIHI